MTRGFGVAPGVWVDAGKKLHEAGHVLAYGRRDGEGVDAFCRAVGGHPFGSDDLGRALFEGHPGSGAAGFVGLRDGLLKDLAWTVNLLRGMGAGLVVGGGKYRETDGTIVEDLGGLPGPVADASPGWLRVPESYTLPQVPGGLPSAAPAPDIWVLAEKVLGWMGVPCQWPEGELFDPLGHLRDAARSMKSVVEDVADEVAGQCRRVTGSGFGAATDAFASATRVVHGEDGLLADLAARCEQLASYCERSGNAIIKARRQCVATATFVGGLMVSAAAVGGWAEGLVAPLIRLEGAALRTALWIIRDAVLGMFFTGGTDGIDQLFRWDGFHSGELTGQLLQGLLVGGLMGVGTHAVLPALLRKSPALTWLSQWSRSPGPRGLTTRYVLSGSIGTGAIWTADGITGHGWNLHNLQDAARTGFGMALTGTGTELAGRAHQRLTAPRTRATDHTNGGTATTLAGRQDPTAGDEGRSPGPRTGDAGGGQNHIGDVLNGNPGHEVVERPPAGTGEGLSTSGGDGSLRDAVTPPTKGRHATAATEPRGPSAEPRPSPNHGTLPPNHETLRPDPEKLPHEPRKAPANSGTPAVEHGEVPRGGPPDGTTVDHGDGTPAGQSTDTAEKPASFASGDPLTIAHRETPRLVEGPGPRDELRHGTQYDGSVPKPGERVPWSRNIAERDMSPVPADVSGHFLTHGLPAIGELAKLDPNTVEEVLRRDPDIAHEFYRIAQRRPQDSAGNNNRNVRIGNLLVRTSIQGADIMDLKVYEESAVLSAIRPYLGNAASRLVHAGRGWSIHAFEEGAVLDDVAPRGVPVPPSMPSDIVNLLVNLAEIPLRELPPIADWPADGNVLAFGQRLSSVTERIHATFKGPFKQVFGPLGFPGEPLRPILKGWETLTPRPFRLLHADLHRKNMIVRPDGHIVVLDWELALPGDPVYDLAVNLYKVTYLNHESQAVLNGWLEKMPPGLTEGWERDLSTYIKSKVVHEAIADTPRYTRQIAKDSLPEEEEHSLIVKLTDKINAAGPIWDSKWKNLSAGKVADVTRAFRAGRR